MRTGGFCGDCFGELRISEPELTLSDGPAPAILTWKGGRFALGYPLGMPLGVDAGVVFQVYRDGELVQSVSRPPALLTFVEDTHHRVEVLGVAAHLAALQQANVLSRTGACRVALRWPGSLADDVNAYRLYANGGSGEVDYDTVVAEVPARSGSVKLAELSWTSGQLADGLWRFGVRTVDAAGNVSESPVRQTDLIAVASLPLPPRDVAAAFDPEHDSLTVTWSPSDSFN